VQFGNTPKGEDGVFCWVGVIQYLPLEEDIEENNIVPLTNTTRNDVSNYFADVYSPMVYELLPPLGVPHWSKILLPRDEAERRKVRNRMRGRYPSGEWVKRRKMTDPERVLGNWVGDWLFEEEDNDK